MKNKLDTIMERLVRLCSEDGVDGLQDASEDEQWGKLFE